VTIKPIRWFEVDADTPAAFYNPDINTCVFCLNYKDYNNLKAGVEPWFLTHSLVNIMLISEWGTDDWWVAINQGAQEMVNYAASDDEVGFKEGDFYGILWVLREVNRSPEVLVGLAYANAATPLIPVQGMIERPIPEGSKAWVTPQFSIPMQVEVQLLGESPKVAPLRVPRYKRTPVI